MYKTVILFCSLWQPVELDLSFTYNMRTHAAFRTPDSVEINFRLI